MGRVKVILTSALAICAALYQTQPVSADPWKAIGKAWEDTKREGGKALENTGEALEKAEKDTGKALLKAGDDTSKAVEKAVGDIKHWYEDPTGCGIQCNVDKNPKTGSAYNSGGSSYFVAVDVPCRDTDSHSYRGYQTITTKAPTVAEARQRLIKEIRNRSPCRYGPHWTDMSREVDPTRPLNWHM